MRIINNSIKLQQHLFFLLLSFVFVTIFSSTSFLYSNYYPRDSTIYQIIGKGWAEGKIPYLDLWDQKGPIIYFINALGYYLTGNDSGLYIIEIVLFASVFSLLYRFYKDYFSLISTSLLLLITICHLSQLCAGGNMIEEYMLPLLIIAFHNIYKWFETAKRGEHKEHPRKWAFLYGIILSFSLLTRLTNAIGICVAVFFILCYLINEKMWNNIGVNALFFVFGFLTLFIPFVLYFYFNDALYEVYYASFLFNVDYIGNVFHEPTTIYAAISFLLAYVNTYGLIIISSVLLVFDKENKWQHFVWLVVSGITMLYFSRTFLYEHYSLISIPYFVIMMIGVKRIKSIYVHCVVIRKGLCMLGISALLVFGLNAIYQIKQELSHISEQSDDLALYEDLIKSDVKDKKDVLCYNLDSSVYLECGVTPSCRFFSMQSWYAGLSMSVRPMIIESTITSAPKYLMVRGKETLIDDYIEHNYTKIKDKNNVVLYKRLE